MQALTRYAYSLNGFPDWKLAGWCAAPTERALSNYSEALAAIECVRAALLTCYGGVVPCGSEGFVFDTALSTV